MHRKIDFQTDRLGRDADVFGEALLDAHEGLSFEQSVRLNARLILILANVIGDMDVLKAAIVEARKAAKQHSEPPGI